MKKITAAELKRSDLLKDVYKKTFPDEVYNMPTSKWLKEEYIPFYVGVLKELGLYEWTEKFDCDDFSCLFRTLAHISHRKSKGTSEGITVAEIHYTAAGTNGVYGDHAINMAYTDEGWVFIEPQNGSMKKLTESEQKSIFYVRM